MASFSTIVPLFSFGQWTGASTNDTVGYPVGTSFTLNEPASLSLLVVNDDDGLPADSPDNLFSDGFLDTPADRVPAFDREQRPAARLAGHAGRHHLSGRQPGRAGIRLHHRFGRSFLGDPHQRHQCRHQRTGAADPRHDLYGRLQP